MPVAKLVGYTLLVNVLLIAALDRIPSDDTTATIELGDYYPVDIQTYDPPPDPPDEVDVWQRSLRIDEPDVDPQTARALAIEEARTSSLLDVDTSHAFDNLERPESEPTTPRRAARLGWITSSGDLDRATIRRYMNRNIDKLESCYQRELLERPTLEGAIVVQFVILPTGSVKDSQGDGFDATVASCVGNVVGTIAFPRQSDGIVQVRYRLTFRRA